MAVDPLASSSSSLLRSSLLLSSLPPFPPDPAWPRTSPWLVPGAKTASFQRARFRPVKVHALAMQSGGPKWWERNGGPNMIDIHSAEEFLDALSQAGDRLVVVEFYGTWCASCRAMFPKLCRTAKDNSDIIFLKVDFDENKAMCKRLNVKVVPYFQFYRGADGQLEAFSCSLAKFQRIKEAIAMHNTPRCSIGPSFNIEGLALLDT